MFGNAPIFTWLLLMMFLCWMVMLYPNGWLGGTRVMMAMSFDRVLPEWFGRVDRRLHVPLNALLTMTAVSIPLAYLYIFQPTIQELTLSYFIILVTTFGVTMIAAILFPYTRKELYNASAAAQYKVLGLPLISVMASIFLAFVVFCDVQALRAERARRQQHQGAALPRRPLGLRLHRLLGEQALPPLARRIDL